MAARQPGLGIRIKRARERMGLTQKELAGFVGRDRKTIDNWENGRTSPRSSIGALEAVLGVSLDGNDPGEPDAGEVELRESLMAIARGGLMTAEDVEAVVASYRRRRNLPPRTRAG